MYVWLPRASLRRTRILYSIGCSSWCLAFFLPFFLNIVFVVFMCSSSLVGPLFLLLKMFVPLIFFLSSKQTNCVYLLLSTWYVVFLTLTDGPQPYPVIHVVGNSVRGLLDRKRSEEHLLPKRQREQKKNTTHSIERVWYRASREPSDTLPGSQPCTQTRSIYHTPYSQGFCFL